MRYRQVIDGSISVPLPDEPVARAKAFGEVATAWSVMLSAIDHLLAANGEGGGKLVQGTARAEPPSEAIPWMTRTIVQQPAWAPSPRPVAPPTTVPLSAVAPAKSPEPVKAKRDHRTAEHMAKMREASVKAAKARKRNKKGK